MNYGVWCALIARLTIQKPWPLRYEKFPGRLSFLAWCLVSLALPSAADPAALKQPLVVSATTLDGSKFDLAQLKNKVVMVYYWSTSCAVCRSHLSELRANLSG